MPKLIVVLGVTGTQGGSVAAKFLQDPEWKVRGITRSASSEAAKILESQGIEIVEADLDKPKTFDNVFKGANAIFAVTDFWAPFLKAYPDLSKKSSTATGEYASEVEMKRAKTFVSAAAKVLEKEKKLEIFVFSSLPNFYELSGGKYTYVYHFDSKAAIAKYIEKEHPALWKKTSLLYMGFYATNDFEYSSWKGGVVKESDGSYTWKRNGPVDAIHPFVEPRDAGLFAQLLVRAGPGKKLLGCGEMMSYRDFSNLWAEHLGIRINTVERSLEECDKLAPGGLGLEAGQSSFVSAEFGWGKDLLLPTDLDPNASVTTMKAYVEKEDRYKTLFPDA